MFALILFLVAAFLAWRDEHLVLVELQKRLGAPEFGGRIDILFWGPRHAGEVVVLAGGFISNPFGPPSAAINWTMKLQFEDREIMGIGMPPSGKDAIIPFSGIADTVTIKADRHWPSVTSEPIPAGGTSGGWVMGLFKGLALTDINSQPWVVLSFVDVVSGKMHYLKIQITSDKRGLNFPWK